MGFGIWHLLQLAMDDSDAYRQYPHLFRNKTTPPSFGNYLKLETPEGVSYMLDTLRRWIRELHVTWSCHRCVARRLI
jgi:pullulanase/glycogen debranching enzyme